MHFFFLAVIIRMGFSYNKRKNIVELAVLRDCTVKPDSRTPVLSSNTDSENRDGDIGWPGMMSIRVHELDGMYDHPILPMAGDAWQLLEIQCHSKLAARRALKPKKGSKPDGCDDNGDAVAVLDMRSRYVVMALKTLWNFFLKDEKLDICIILQHGISIVMD